jgi:hypothetical protein
MNEADASAGATSGTGSAASPVMKSSEQIHSFHPSELLQDQRDDDNSNNNDYDDDDTTRQQQEVF